MQGAILRVSTVKLAVTEYDFLFGKIIYSVNKCHNKIRKVI